MTPPRRRILYAMGLVVVIAEGLASRRFGDVLPAVVATYAGDTLWASTGGTIARLR